MAIVTSAIGAASNPRKSVADVYTRSEKGLWDGEPGAIVAACERAHPDFFSDRSGCCDPDRKRALIKKKALVGRIMNQIYCDGQPKHGKEMRP